MEVYDLNNTSLLKDEITSRYAMFQPTGISNIFNTIIDNYVPYAMTSNFYVVNNMLKDGKSKYALSEWFAEEFDAHLLSMKHILKILNINEKELKKTLVKLKRQRQNLILLGAGGTGQNFAYWTYRLLEHFEMINLFDRILVIDDDNFEFTNLLRIPYQVKSISKAKSILKFDTLSRKMFVDTVRYDPKNNFFFDNFYSYFFDRSNYDHYYPNEKTTMYGAPDIRTREELNQLQEDVGIPIRFVAGLHGDDECDLTIMPEANTDLQIESYGMIKLTTFYFNQIMMTINFLKFLADEDPHKWDKRGEPMWKFNFKQFVDEGKNGTPTKTIKFALFHNGLMQQNEVN